MFIIQRRGTVLPSEIKPGFTHMQSGLDTVYLWGCWAWGVAISHSSSAHRTCVERVLQLVG